jgi:hypothetical protein
MTSSSGSRVSPARSRRTAPTTSSRWAVLFERRGGAAFTAVLLVEIIGSARATGVRRAARACVPTPAGGPHIGVVLRGATTTGSGAATATSGSPDRDGAGPVAPVGGGRPRGRQRCRALRRPVRAIPSGVAASLVHPRPAHGRAKDLLKYRVTQSRWSCAPAERELASMCCGTLGQGGTRWRTSSI